MGMLGVGILLAMRLTLDIDLDIARLRAVAEVRSDSATLARFSVETRSGDFVVVDLDGRTLMQSDRWDYAAERAIDLASELVKHHARTAPLV